MKTGPNKDIAALLKTLNISHTSQDIAKLETNIIRLDWKGLSKANERLLTQNKPPNFLAALAEHNFIASLLTNLPNGELSQISYEPCDAEGVRPPDLHIVWDGVTYWIQIKRLSGLKRDNLQDKLFREIEQQVKKIKVNKFLNLQLSKEFTSKNIKELMEFVTSKAQIQGNDIDHMFQCATDGARAIVNFTASTTKLECLTLGVYGGMGWLI